MPRSQKNEIRNTFKKFAEGRQQPNNFGKALTNAIRDGFLEEEFATQLLGVKPQQIRQKGNAMNTREIQKISQAIVSREQKNEI